MTILILVKFWFFKFIDKYKFYIFFKFKLLFNLKHIFKKYIKKNCNN